MKRPLSIVDSLQKKRPPRNVTPLGAPTFPGVQGGKTVDEVRAYIKQQARLKGYQHTVDTGTTPFNIQLSGTARHLLGLALQLDPAQLAAGTTPDSVTLTINNEVVVATVKPEFLSFQFTDEEFYHIPRPLDGTDEIVLSYTNSNAAQTVNVVFYYL